MPTAAFASHYWPGDGVGPGPVAPVVSRYQYPYWFDHTVCGMAMIPFKLPVPRQRYAWERHVKHARGWWIKHVWQRAPLRVLALWLAMRLIFSPAFTAASNIVREVAKNPSTRKMDDWGEVERIASRRPGLGENMYRSLHASLQLSIFMPSLSASDREAVIELAHLAFKDRGL